MKIGIFYFTTSGNTEALADILEKTWSDAGHDVVKKDFSESDSSDLDGLDLVALGSPAQGEEEVDDSEFRPFYEDNLDELKGKKIFLFGCFGWGGGEYMENFAEEAKGEGLDVVGHFTHLEEPDDDTAEELSEQALEVIA